MLAGSCTGRMNGRGGRVINAAGCTEDAHIFLASGAVLLTIGVLCLWPRFVCLSAHLLFSIRGLHFVKN